MLYYLNILIELIVCHSYSRISANGRCSNGVDITSYGKYR